MRRPRQRGTVRRVLGGELVGPSTPKGAENRTPLRPRALQYRLRDPPR